MAVLTSRYVCSLLGDPDKFHEDYEPTLGRPCLRLCLVYMPAYRHG